MGKMGKRQHQTQNWDGAAGAHEFGSNWGMSPFRWRVFVGSLSVLILLCLAPFSSSGPRHLSVTEVAKVRGPSPTAPKLPKITPAIISYPDANVSRHGTNDDDDHSDDGESKEQKPYFILHVGPPKTATTTLQTEMTKYGEQLDRDNYVYLGQVSFHLQVHLIFTTWMTDLY